MTLTFSAMMLALFGISLILITLSLRFLRGTNLDNEKVNTPARFFLIALRLAIGWHCFIEGMEKISTPNWSSEVYLRESVGPAAPLFQRVAGDRLVEKLTLGAQKTMPPQLDREWRGYVTAFTAYHALTKEQQDRALAVLTQREKEMVDYLQNHEETVTRISAYPPTLRMDMKMDARLKEHDRLLQRVREIEAQFPSGKKDVHDQWKAAKADLAKWRADLKRNLDAQTDKLKQALELEAGALPILGVSVFGMLASSMDPQQLHAVGTLFPGRPAGVAASVPAAKSLPREYWKTLEWSDFLVKWGLIVLGSCLMLGFLSRAACVATALLILSFFAAMPPLPGWPESPRLEGHYLLINKTLIEAIALLALACMPTGRWAGVDGLLCMCCRGRGDD